MKLIYNICILLLKFNFLKKIIYLAFLLLSFSIISQTTKKELFVKYTTNKIVVDGVLDESDWSKTIEASNFYEHFPNHGSPTKNEAIIKVMNDDDFLYIGIKVFASTEKLKINSFRRDFEAGNSDNITMIFDTFNDGSNAFVIGSNHYGIQRDMLLFNGGGGLQDWDMTWDIKWVSNSKIYDNYYITEWKIPLSAFKYREGETKWGVNSYMRNTENNTWNSWNEVPENLMFFNLGFTGIMNFEKPLGKSKAKKSIIPYINSVAYNDFENIEKGNSFEFGGDAKFIIDNSLTLDLTVNPDFHKLK